MKALNIKQLKDKSDKIQQELKKQLGKAGCEGKKVLRDLGVKSKNSNLSVSNLQEVFADIKHYNQSPRKFLRNLDFATYDTRQQIQWNSNMALAYTKQKIGNTYSAYSKRVNPKISSYKDQLNDQLNKQLGQVKKVLSASKKS